MSPRADAWIGAVAAYLAGEPLGLDSVWVVGRRARGLGRARHAVASLERALTSAVPSGVRSVLLAPAPEMAPPELAELRALGTLAEWERIGVALIQGWHPLEQWIEHLELAGLACVSLEPASIRLGRSLRTGVLLVAVQVAGKAASDRQPALAVTGAHGPGRDSELRGSWRETERRNAAFRTAVLSGVRAVELGGAEDSSSGLAACEPSELRQVALGLVAAVVRARQLDCDCARASAEWVRARGAWPWRVLEPLRAALGAGSLAPLSSRPLAVGESVRELRFAARSLEELAPIDSETAREIWEARSRALERELAGWRDRWNGRLAVLLRLSRAVAPRASHVGTPVPGDPGGTATVGPPAAGSNAGAAGRGAGPMAGREAGAELTVVVRTGSELSLGLGVIDALVRAAELSRPEPWAELRWISVDATGDLDCGGSLAAVSRPAAACTRAARRDSSGMTVTESLTRAEALIETPWVLWFEPRAAGGQARVDSVFPAGVMDAGAARELAVWLETSLETLRRAAPELMAFGVPGRASMPYDGIVARRFALARCLGEIRCLGESEVPEDPGPPNIGVAGLDAGWSGRLGPGAAAWLRRLGRLGRVSAPEELPRDGWNREG